MKNLRKKLSWWSEKEDDQLVLQMLLFQNKKDWLGVLSTLQNETLKWQNLNCWKPNLLKKNKNFRELNKNLNNQTWHLDNF